MAQTRSRREMLRFAAGAGLTLGASAVLPGAPASRGRTENPRGRVEGWPGANEVGETVLEAGGNAADAVVAAALAAGVIAPQMCGPGGYGGHAVYAARDGGVSAVDFNSAAPAAFRDDIFPPDAAGGVVGRVHETGWLVAGVPGVLAGLQLVLDRFGTRTFAQCAGPAVRLARDGFPVGPSLAAAVRSNAGRLRKDPATAALLLPGGGPPEAGAVLRNPDLAALLETLAQRGSVETFYRGDLAARVAAAFRAGGGFVTEADLAAYRAREVEPLGFEWNGRTVRTPPPTAGGLTALEGLAVLKALGWERDADSFGGRRAFVETLRVVWRDRLRSLGDPEQADVPVARLLGEDHVASLADEVSRALKENRPVAAGTDGRPAGGTVHLSAGDAAGNFAALTLTHGGSFGAQATVPGLGLTLGHGMSRFDPRPGRPNSPGPGKRPLHNMCPAVVLAGGRPVLAVGGRGGRRIVNGVFAVLAHAAGRGLPVEAALAAPRCHTEGGLDLELEPSWPAADSGPLAALGYRVRRSAPATVSAVWTGSDTGALRAASR